MDLPPVHMCVFLSREYEQLKAKVIKLKTHIIQLEQRIPEKTRSCSIACQADIRGVQKRSNSPTKADLEDESIESEIELLKNRKNELLQKYEQESVEKRYSQARRTSPLIEDFERRLIQSRNRTEQTDKRAASAQKRSRQFEERFEHMKQKFSVFDDGFFEEVNHLKFALQQATHLNREYEKTIEMLSAQLGIKYPLDG